jgi:hypothetical protein
MWGPVLVMALLVALDPVRLGIILLVISRPRPVQNLFAYWVASLIASFPAALVPLMLVHGTPMLRSFAQDLTDPDKIGNPTVRHIQTGMGILVLSITAQMMVRSVIRRRKRAQLPAPAGNASALSPDPNTPTAVARLLSRAQEAAAEGGSAIRRLLGRAYNAWENGSLWVAWVIGFVLGGPGTPELLVVLVIIVASGAAIGTQVSAVIAFIIGMLAVVEIVLISHLATPTKTQPLLQLLHNWVLAHRREIVAAMCAVGGAWLLAGGISSS